MQKMHIDKTLSSGGVFCFVVPENRLYEFSLVIVQQNLCIYALNDLNLNKNNIMKDKCFLFSWSWWCAVVVGSIVGTFIGWQIADLIIWVFDL